MGAEGFILANPCIPRFLKGLTHSAVGLRMMIMLIFEYSGRFGGGEAGLQ